MQFHGGVYRSDDSGESWVEIGEGLLSDFGFPLAVDPDDPDSAFVIPLQADVDRVTPEGRVRVFETRDAGDTWTSRVSGLPQRHAYLTVLRLAFDRAKSDAGRNCISAPRRARCSGHPTPAQPGPASPLNSRRSTRSRLPHSATASPRPMADYRRRGRMRERVKAS